MSVESNLEVELKFSPGDAAVPDFSAAAAIDAVSGPVIRQLCALYFDTADAVLSRNKITLRRRTGGKDDGWHVKLPGNGGRVELHSPATQGEQSPPAQLLAHVADLVGDSELVEVARIDNERHEYVLISGDCPVVEFVDDHVTGYHQGRSRSWREWECERIGNSPAAITAFDQACSVVRSAGVPVSVSPSKLAQSLEI